MIPLGVLARWSKLVEVFMTQRFPERSVKHVEFWAGCSRLPRVDTGPLLSNRCAWPVFNSVLFLFSVSFSCFMGGSIRDGNDERNEKNEGKKERNEK